MTNPLSANMLRPDIMPVETAPRPTPAPLRVNFKQALSNAGDVAKRTMQAAVGTLPGSSIVATALRGPAVPLELGPTTRVAAASPSISAAADGPGAAGGGDIAGEAQSTLAAGQDSAMAMLKLQCEVSQHQNTFTTMSNILKSQSDTEKTAINNIK